MMFVVTLLTGYVCLSVGHVVSEDHKLPKGGMFDLVSSPQLLNEILIQAAIGELMFP